MCRPQRRPCRRSKGVSVAQQMPLPLTVSCSSKSRLVLTFLVLPFWCLLTWVVPDIFQKSSKTVVCCVCVIQTKLNILFIDVLENQQHESRQRAHVWDKLILADDWHLITPT